MNLFFSWLKRPTSTNKSTSAQATQNYILLHHHIFKNAGTTVDGILKNNFGLNHIELDTKSADGIITQDMLLNTIAEHKNIKAISSHHFHCQEFKSATHTFLDIIFLRHPMDRLRSGYEFYHAGFPTPDPFAKLAQQMSMREYFEYLINNHPYLVNDVQTTILANHGNYKTPSLDDYVRSIDRLQKAFIIGVVESIDNALVLAESLTKFSHPNSNVNFAYQVENALSHVGSTLQERLEKMRADCGSQLYENLTSVNQLDMKLINYVNNDIKNKELLLPDFEDSLAKFKNRCKIDSDRVKVI